MFCPYCGSAINNANGSCPACGARLGEAAGVPEEYMSGGGSHRTGATFDYMSQPNVSASADVRPTPEPAPASVPVSQPEPESRPTYEVAYPAAKDTDDKMPSSVANLILVVVGFLCGVIWGVIALIQYNKMNAAIEQGDVQTAKAKAQNVKIAVGIGVALTLIALLGTCSQAASVYR